MGLSRSFEIFFFWVDYNFPNELTWQHCWNLLTIKVVVYFWVLYFITLIYMSILMPVSIVASLQDLMLLDSVNSPSLFFFTNIVLAILEPLHFHKMWNYIISLYHFAMGIFIGNMLNKQIYLGTKGILINWIFQPMSLICTSVF